MSESYPLAQGPAELEELVTRARRGHGRVNLTDDDTTVAVIIPLADYQELQAAADQADLAEAEAVKSRGEWISHADALKMLEIGDADPS